MCRHQPQGYRNEVQAKPRFVIVVFSSLRQRRIGNHVEFRWPREDSSCELSVPGREDRCAPPRSPTSRSSARPRRIGALQPHPFLREQTDLACVRLGLTSSSTHSSILVTSLRQGGPPSMTNMAETCDAILLHRYGASALKHTLPHSLATGKKKSR